MLLETGIGLGLKGLSTLLGSKADKRAQKNYQAQMAQSQAQFDAQMDTSVQRRVKDAKSAGVHPLFAMGASVGASPTISAGQAPQGSQAARGVSSLAEALGVVGMNEAAAKRDIAEAQLLDSERARLEQDARSQGLDHEWLQEIPMRGKRTVGGGQIGPHTFYEPEVPYSSRSGVRSGVVPEMIEYENQAGEKNVIPNPDLNMDEVGQFMYVWNKIKDNWRAMGRKYSSDAQYREARRIVKEIKNKPRLTRAQRLENARRRAQNYGSNR